MKYAKISFFKMLPESFHWPEVKMNYAFVAFKLKFAVSYPQYQGAMLSVMDVKAWTSSVLVTFALEARGESSGSTAHPSIVPIVCILM